jgi:HEAT repeat protein
MRPVLCTGCLFLSVLLFTNRATAQRQPAQSPQPNVLAAQLSDQETGPAAVEQLARLEPRVAVPLLTKALGADYPAEVRWRAERALAHLGPAASDSVGAIIANLKDSNEWVRAYACFALGRIGGPAGQTAVPSLVEGVTDESALVRRAAIDAIVWLRPDRKLVLPLMARALEDAEPRIVMAAIRTLTSEGPAAVPLLSEALENGRTAYWAAVGLESLGPDAAPAVQPLARLALDQEPEVRMQALMALAAIGEAARPAAAQMIDRLHNDEFAGVQYAAAYALAKVGAGAEADAALLKTMQSRDPLLAMLSAWALAKAHPEDTEIAQRATDLIVQGLKSENPSFQAAAARALAESKLSSDMTEPALEQALEHASPQVVAQIVAAIATQGAKATPWIIKSLQNEKLRGYAFQVLSMVGPDAAEAVPEVSRLLDSSDGDARRDAQFALAAIGPAAAPAVPQLSQSLSSENEEVQYSAIYALGRIGEQAKDACPELMKVLEREEEFPRIAALWALSRIDPGRPEVVETGVPLLAKALQSDREAVRAEAAATLGEIGEPARPALSELKQALDDPTAAVQEAAKKAIERIEGRSKD